ncbi:unnamed protein product [Camellia sinensis]
MMMIRYNLPKFFNLQSPFCLTCVDSWAWQVCLKHIVAKLMGQNSNHMLGIYMQCSWVVLFLRSILLLPLFVFPTPILKLTGQSAVVAELAGVVALWLIPMHLSFAF